MTADTGAKAAIRKLFGLDPYSDRIEARLTGRHRLSLQLIGSRPGQKVVDIGASYGWLEELGPQQTGAQFFGVEYDERALGQAHKNVSSASIVKGSVLEMPFAAESFDGAVMLEVLEHIPVGTEVLALKEIHRVLKPGGWFVLSTPFSDPRSRLLDPAAYFGHRHYSAGSVSSMFEEAGFRVQQVFVKGAWWECGTMIMLYIFKHLVSAEIPWKQFFERRRAQEFLGDGQGFSTLFISAVRA